MAGGREGKRPTHRCAAVIRHTSSNSQIPIAIPATRNVGGRTCRSSGGDQARPSGRSTRDLLNTIATITDRKAGFGSLGDAWAGTITVHGCLIPPALGGLAEFERELIRAHTGEGRARAKAPGKSLGRPFNMKLHWRKEVLARRESGELLTEITRSYNVSAATISRLEV